MCVLSVRDGGSGDRVFLGECNLSAREQKVSTHTQVHTHTAYVNMWTYAWIQAHKQASKQTHVDTKETNTPTHMFTPKSTSCSRFPTVHKLRVLKCTDIII